MMEWKEVLFEDIIEEISMGPFGSDIKRDCYCEEGLPYLNGSNVQNFKLGEESFIYVPWEKAEKLKKSVAHRGDVIITHRGTLGQVVYIPTDSIYPKYLISNSQFRVKFDSSKVRADYITYYLHTRDGNHKIMANASQVGVPALGRPTTTFKQIKAPIPPLEYQNRVMDILSSLDKKIETNNKINANLEEMAQAIFKNWFVDFAPFKDGKFVESELGMIPEGWRVGTLTEIIKLLPGGTPKTTEPSFWDNGNIPFFSPKDVTGIYCYDTEKHITEAGLNKCSSGLYAKDTIFITCRGTVGKITMSACDMAMNQSNYAIKGIDGYSQYYIFFIMRSIVERLLKKANGAVFSAITTKDFDEAVIIPPLNVIKDFDECMKSTFTKIYTIGKENAHLASIRDTLLPRLMSGEIEV